jgi:hypothetical protein
MRFWSAAVATVVLAWSAGIVLDVDGRGFAATATVNLLGFAAIYTVARTAAWLKLPHDQNAGFAVHHSTRPTAEMHPAPIPQAADA